MYALALLATWGSTLLAPVWGAVTWDAAPFNPPAVPLAVRTPYLSAWLAQGSGTALNAGWPTFWTGSVRVPTLLLFVVTSYVLLGSRMGRLRQSRWQDLQLARRSNYRWCVQGYSEELEGEYIFMTV